ncbi:MAG: DUF1585 domain-containing protein [Alphaproteobacteria bacterium]|nr:DUF1585 domain-containing protein [Alphaproteobacteria bacterium]
MIALLLLLGGCAEPELTLTPLDAPRLARRISLDLRGVLPSVAELDAVEADPTQLASLRAEWLEDPRLEQRLVELMAERWRTRLDHFLFDWDEYAVLRDDWTLRYAWHRAVSDEPLRLMARVVVEDRPWTEVVTSDETLADPVLLSIWPLEALEEGEGWVRARYTDGRPGAGVLSTSGLWMRYWTTESNRNRGRAAAISRLLLCEDYLNRPVRISSESAAADTESALRSDPYCLGCHASLDPIAATLFGFWPTVEYNGEEVGRYHPEREPLYEELLGVTPAFFGQPVAGLEALGEAIAADPRFARCAVSSFAEGLWRRPPEAEDDAVIEALRAELVADDMRIKGLLIGITESETYQAGRTPEGSRHRGTRLLSPNQLHSAVQELSGFVWEREGYDQLDNDEIGYRLAAGGVDGSAVTRPQRDPGMTWSLTVQRLAQAAADAVVDEGLGQSALLSGVDADTAPGDPAFEAQLRALHWALLATRPAPADLLGLTELWRVGEAEGGAELGWRLVLEALLRDPLFVSY